MKDCVEAHPEYYGAMANVDDDDDDAMEGEIVNEEEPAAESEVEEPVTAEGAAIQETQETQDIQIQTNQIQETQTQTQDIQTAQETQTQETQTQETQTQTNQETQTA